MRESIFEDFTLSNSASSFPCRRTVVAGRVQSAFGILGVRMQRKAAWKEVVRGLALFKRVWSFFVSLFFVFSLLSKSLCCHIVNSYYGASMQRGFDSSPQLSEAESRWMPGVHWHSTQPKASCTFCSDLNSSPIVVEPFQCVSRPSLVWSVNPCRQGGLRPTTWGQKISAFTLNSLSTALCLPRNR